MGTYTEIYINVNLKPDTPDEIVEVLRGICNFEYEGSKNPQWAWLFGDGSFYTPSTSCANLTYSDIGRCWSLLGKGDLKNYDNQIEDFFKWIMPYIDAEQGDFVGYKRCEEDKEPTLIYKR